MSLLQNGKIFYNKTESFLGLDLGEKTLGIAISRFGIIAQNLKTIVFHRHQYHELIIPLKEIIEKFAITTIILGYPKHMNNDIGIKARISSLFKLQIQKVYNLIEVILWDERLSTKQAKLFIQKYFKKKIQKKVKDEITAMIILQSFLHYRNNLIKEDTI
ncbi:MAG: Holliday junction resolvase RuvX [Vigna little leaf phytoplasma]|nr:Holliday junction resolvase RuvX [Vigna little leaf phytoplasma]